MVPAPLALVTGAGGYSGHFLVTKLLEEGFRVRGLDRHVPREPAGVDWREADLRDARALQSACEGVEVVFHAGAIVPFNLPRAIGKRLITEVNVHGTQKLVEACRDQGVERLIHLSSTGVVFAGRPISGGDETLPIPEKHNDHYSWSKSRAERIVLEANSDALRTLAIRPNGIWGPGERHHIPKVLATARLRLNRVNFGADALTDWTHRENLVQALFLANEKLQIDHATVGGQAYFVTDGEVYNTLAFFDPLIESLGFSTKRAELPGWMMFSVGALCQAVARLVAPIRPIEPFVTVADVRKVIYDNYYVSNRAKRDLGYRPRVDRERGMAECIAYYRRHGVRPA